MREQLERLVNKWREDFHDSRGTDGDLASRSCAEELQSILDSQPHLAGQIGLSVTCGEDGAWLHFAASNGKSASLSVDALAGKQSSIFKTALLDWQDDQMRERAKPQPRFVAGMKIGPGHGRLKEFTLCHSAKQSDAVAESWWVKEETFPLAPLWFYSDDLSRVIYDPRKPAPILIGPLEPAAPPEQPQTEFSGPHWERLAKPEQWCDSDYKWIPRCALIDLKQAIERIESKLSSWPYNEAKPNQK